MTGKLTMTFAEIEASGMTIETEIEVHQISVMDKLCAVEDFMTAFKFDESDRALLALMLMSGAKLAKRKHLH